MPRNHDRERGERRRASAALVQLALAVVCVLLGALLSFVPEVDIALLSCVFCALLVAAGVAAIAYYFVAGGYRRLEDYGFALGVLLLALGCCGFARIADVEAAFTVYLGFAALILGVLALQNAVQLRVIGSRAAIAALVCTAAILFLALSVLMQFRALMDALGYLVYLIAGGLGLVSLIVTAIVLHGAAKRAEQPPEEAPQPMPEAFAPTAPPPPPPPRLGEEEHTEE